MKTLLTIAACALFTSHLHAGTTFVEDAPAGFIHLVEDDTDKNPESGNEKVSKQKYDVYISTSMIGIVTLEDFGNGNFEVDVRTTVPAPPNAAGTMQYSIEFTDKEKAQACVKKILGIMQHAAAPRATN